MDREKIEGELSSPLIVKEKPRDGVGHVFSVWFNIDDWSNDRCSNERENSRLRWSNTCKIGKWKECEASLQRDNADISDEADEIIDYTEQLQQLTESMFDLFQKEYAWSISLTDFPIAMDVVHVSSSWLALSSEKNLQYVPMTPLGVILLDKSG
ncbi:hypothetical protein GQ457_06G020440 [Hibiscus cannabinus]